MTKFKIGGIYVANPNKVATVSSSNTYLQKGYKFKVTAITPGYEHLGGYLSVHVQSSKGGSWINGGVVYGVELKSVPTTQKELLKEVADIEQEIEEKKSEIENLNTKIQFLESSGLLEYDEDTFKVFQAITIIENRKLSKLEKAKVIGELINS